MKMKLIIQIIFCAFLPRLAKYHQADQRKSLILHASVFYRAVHQQHSLLGWISSFSIDQHLKVLSPKHKLNLHWQ